MKRLTGNAAETRQTLKTVDARRWIFILLQFLGFDFVVEDLGSYTQLLIGFNVDANVGDAARVKLDLLFAKCCQHFSLAVISVYFWRVILLSTLSLVSSRCH